MNVSSLEVSKELYELSGWKNTYCDYDNFEGYAIHFTCDRPSDHTPAYDLGYLLRKLPQAVTVKKDGKHFIASHLRVDTEGGWYYKEEKTPEDAVAKIAIELFKEGILEVER